MGKAVLKYLLAEPLEHWALSHVPVCTFGDCQSAPSGGLFDEFCREPQQGIKFRTLLSQVLREARGLNILSCIEWIRLRDAKMITSTRDRIPDSATGLCPQIAEKVGKAYDRSKCGAPTTWKRLFLT
eukprot:TRINITY_DN1607_c0_g1_i1.p2 TRINITY_DN1607_c0_g1~~TRINITY_DN1607_c0_g1_i1.p2  ORF type:complete len:127 (-),score=3.31 TRINITY_DN1607_c0_g1_i1:221-601(-)